jgi:phage terminase large subunit
MFGDPEDPEAMVEANRAGLRVVPASKEVSGGIEAVRKFGISGKIFVLRRCTNLVDEFQTYHYPEPQEDREVKDEPVRVNNHLMDCLRYTIFTFMPTPPKTLSKRGEDPIWELIRKDMGKKGDDFDQDALDNWSQDGIMM